MSLKRLLLIALVCGATPMASASTLDIDTSGMPGFKPLGFSSSRVQRVACKRTQGTCLALNRTVRKLALTGAEAGREPFGGQPPQAQRFVAGLDKADLGRAGLNRLGGRGAGPDYKNLLTTDLGGGGGGKDDTPPTNTPVIPAIPPLAAVPVPAAGLLLALALSGFAVLGRQRRKLV